MTITEARIALDKLGWHQLAVKKHGTVWWARMYRKNCNEYYQLLARKRHDAIERIVLWAQLEAKKADNAADAAGGGE